MRPSSPERDPGRRVAALIRRDRAQVRDALGFRPATRADEEALAGWLAAEVAPAEPSDDRLRETLLTRWSLVAAAGPAGGQDRRGCHV